MSAGPGVPLLRNIAGICALETCLWQNPAGQYRNNCKFILSLQLLHLFLFVILIYVLKQKIIVLDFVVLPVTLPENSRFYVSRLDTIKPCVLSHPKTTEDNCKLSCIKFYETDVVPKHNTIEKITTAIPLALDGGLR